MPQNANQMKKVAFSVKFNKFYRSEIAPMMQKVESKRIFYLIFFYIFLVIGLIGMFGCIMACIFHIRIFLMDIHIYIYLSLFIVVPVLLVKYYESSAKNLFLQKLLSFLGNFKIIKEKEKKVSVITYIQSLSLLPSFNSYQVDDYFYGTYNGVDIKISDICLKRVISSENGSRTITVFAGIFLTLKSFKKYKGKTTIGLNDSGLLAGKNKVNLEDPVFESYYDVVSNDQVEARYLITPAFMERLIELNKKFGTILLVSFEQGNINIAIEKSNSFELSMFKSATNIDNYRKIIFELSDILSIVDTLKLEQNTGA